jgi:cytochrome b561
VVGTSARWLTLRAAIACIAAYVLVLHSMLAGAVLASQDPSPVLPFFPICHAASDAGETTPDAPNQQLHDHSHCTLCGAGHCGLALPTGIKQLHHAPAAVAGAIFTAETGVAPRRFEIVAQPRGPPVSA